MGNEFFLKPIGLGVVLNKTHSTQVFLKENLNSYTWALALQQSQGRGRQGGHWDSPLGNLYVSFKVPLKNWTENLPATWVGLKVSLALYEGLRLLLLEQHIDPEPLKIKWPNDLYYRGKKLAGVIAEQVGEDALVGVGLNKVPTQNLYSTPPISLCEIGEQRIKTPFDLFQYLVGFIHSEFFKTQTQVRFLECSYFKPGEQICWKDSKGALQAGVFNGLGEMGEMLVLPQGHHQVLKLYSEDVSKIRAVK